MAKYLITLFTALFIGIFNQLPAHATWAFVQGQTQAGSSASSVAATFGSSVTAGHLVVVNLVWYSSPTVVNSVTDSASNTYSLAISNTSTAASAATYYTVATTGGAFTVTVNFSLGAYASITINEYSFTPGTISVSNTNSVANTTNSTPASGNVTFTATKALIIGTIQNATQGETITPSTGFTLRNQVLYVGGTNEGVYALDYLNATSSPQNPGGTLGTSAQWTALGASFQSSGDMAVTNYGGVFSGSPLLPQQ